MFFKKRYWGKFTILVLKMMGCHESPHLFHLKNVSEKDTWNRHRLVETDVWKKSISQEWKHVSLICLLVFLKRPDIYSFFYFKPWYILKETTEPTGPFGTIPQDSLHPGRSAKPDRIIQLNYREIHTFASYKTTRTWENSSNRGEKIILLSDKLANNSKSFEKGRKSIINNSALCKCSEI